MSVYKQEDGTTIIELGKGTTGVGLAMNGDTDVAIGVAFSNLNENRQAVGDKIVIQICNQAGFVSYVKSIFDMVATWEFTGEDPNKIIEVKKQMDELHKTLKSM